MLSIWTEILRRRDIGSSWSWELRAMLKIKSWKMVQNGVDGYCMAGLRVPLIVSYLSSTWCCSHHLRNIGGMLKNGRTMKTEHCGLDVLDLDPTNTYLINVNYVSLRNFLFVDPNYDHVVKFLFIEGLTFLALKLHGIGKVICYLYSNFGLLIIRVQI